MIFNVIAFKVWDHGDYMDVKTMQGDVLRVEGMKVKPLDRLAVDVVGSKVVSVKKQRKKQCK